MRSSLLALFFATSATAHFILNYPVSAGFDDDGEPSAPCGSETINLSNTTDFHVGGNSFAVTAYHPEITYLLRVTTDANAQSNYTQIEMPIQQTGLGSFCIPQLMIPSSFAGSKGVLQVIADSPDGILYQCAALNFVSGAASEYSGCMNASGVSASFTSDATLTNLASNTTTSNSTGTTSSGGSTTSSSTTASTSAAHNAAMGMKVDSGVQGLMSVMLFSGIAGVAFISQLL